MGKKVLIVDDAITVRSLLKFALDKGGYTLVEAEDGVKGLEAAKANHDIRLIITDLNMPNMNGLEMCQAIKEIDQLKTIPIFMLTTEASVEMTEKGKAVGIKAWIVKPFVPDTLLSAVKKVLNDN